MLRGSSSIARRRSANSLVPMPECSLHPGDRFYNISAIRKTLFGLPEFCERARVVLLVISASKVNFWKVRIERERVIEGILSGPSCWFLLNVFLSMHFGCCPIERYAQATT